MINFKKRFKNLFNLYKFVLFLYESQSKFRRFIIKSGILVVIAVLIFKMSKKIFNSFKNREANDRLKSSLKQDHNNNNLSVDSVSSAPAVNKVFFSELFYLLSLMFPRFLCKPTGLLFMHTIVLVFRFIFKIILGCNLQKFKFRFQFNFQDILVNICSKTRRQSGKIDCPTRFQVILYTADSMVVNCITRYNM
jgi:hypothetical protein